MRMTGKSLLCFLICLITVALCGCSRNGNTAQTTETRPADTAETYGEPQELTVDTIVSPYAGKLSGKALTPWDMAFDDGWLYVGAGDFDKNVAPGKFYRYNVADGEWTACGACYDEQISRFSMIDGKLTVPGTDPTESWDYGNYYVLGDSGFSRYRNIPNGVHTFDVIEYNGTIFTGDGVVDGIHPVALSKIGSGTFKRVRFYKDGKVLDLSKNQIIRVYDFFILNDTLYAMLTVDGQRSVYTYGDNKFVYYASVYDKIEFTSGEWYFPIRAKETVGDTVYFTTGYLYLTKDMNEFTKVTVGGVQRFTDLLKWGDDCFALGWHQNGKDSYENRVYAVDGTECHLVCKFTSSSPALSFARSDDAWWFGLGGNEIGNIAYAKLG